MDWFKAEDIHKGISNIVKILDLKHIDSNRVVCFRSFGSSSRARARIWSLPRVWQMALNVKAHYVVEVLSEKYDKLSKEDKERVLIHELMHIPKNFSGSLIPHRGRGTPVNSKTVEILFRQFKKNCRS